MPSSSSSSSNGARSALTPILLALMMAIVGMQVAQHYTWLTHHISGPGLLPAHWVRPDATPGAPVPECKRLTGSVADARAHNGTQRVEFCEDVEMLEGKGLEGWALLSCDAGRAEWNTVMGPLLKPELRGALWMYNYAEFDSSPTLLNLKGYPESATFHPLGTAVLPASATHPARLFVANHAKEASQIDVFDITQSATGAWEAQYVRSVQHFLATHTPNGIVALSRNSFIVSQDHLFALRSPSAEQLVQLWQSKVGNAQLARAIATLVSSKPLSLILPRVETLLGLPLSWVTHVSFTEAAVEAHVIVSGIAFANGISLSPAQTTLAVASTLTPGITLWTRKAGVASWAEKLSQSGSISTPQGVDNIAFTTSESRSSASDPFDGARLIATGHPHGLRLIWMAKSPRDVSRAAGSWSVDIVPSSRVSAGVSKNDTAPKPAHEVAQKANEKWTVRTLYQSAAGAAPGTPSSAGGAVEGDKLLLGGLYGYAVICRNVGL